MVQTVRHEHVHSAPLMTCHDAYELSFFSTEFHQIVIDQFTVTSLLSFSHPKLGAA